MKLARLITLALIAVTVTGCSVNPVTGKRQLNFYSEEDEIALGAEADPAIRSQYGELDDPYGWIENLTIEESVTA